MENYVKLYTSKLFAKGKWEREIKAQWIDRVVDAIGDLHRDPTNRFGIQSIDITWEFDLVLAFKDRADAEGIVDSGHAALQLEEGAPRMIIPTSPLIPRGFVNYRRYLVRARFQMGVAPMAIVQALVA